MTGGLRGLSGQGMDGRKRSVQSTAVYAQGFTSSGATPAQAVTVLAQIWLIAPGGGGGGGGSQRDGGGGGGAVYDDVVLAPGQVLNFTIGAAGVGAQAAPSTAGDVTLTMPGGRNLRAQGGQGRIGGRGSGGKRNYEGGDGGVYANAGAGTGGPGGPATGGDGQDGQGGASNYGGGGGGAASPGVPAGLLATTYPANAGSNGTNSGVPNAGGTYGGGGGASSDFSGGSNRGSAGGPGAVVVVMTEVVR